MSAMGWMLCWALSPAAHFTPRTCLEMLMPSTASRVQKMRSMQTNQATQGHATGQWNAQDSIPGLPDAKRRAFLWCRASLCKPREAELSLGWHLPAMVLPIQAPWSGPWGFIQEGLGGSVHPRDLGFCDVHVAGWPPKR